MTGLLAVTLILTYSVKADNKTIQWAIDDNDGYHCATAICDCGDGTFGSGLVCAKTWDDWKIEANKLHDVLCGW